MRPSLPKADYSISLLEQILNQRGFEATVCFVFPNVILTLAGARSFSDGVFYHRDKAVLEKWQAEVDAAAAALTATGNIIFRSYIDKNPANSHYLSYDLINLKGLENTLPGYAFLDKEKVKDFLSQPLSFKLPDRLMKIVRRHKAFEKMAKEELGAITHGMFLGYPEKAILAALPYWFSPKDKFALPLIPAAIRGANYYTCPQPVYSYPRELVNDPTINQHEQLWSNILQGYYTSDFHQALEKDKDFQNKLSQLTRF